MRSSSSYNTIDPSQDKVVWAFPESSDKELASALARADAGFKIWRQTSFAERKALLLKVASILEADASHFAQFVSLEMGKPLAQAIAEVKKCALACRHYATSDFDKILDPVFPQHAGSTTSGNSKEEQFYVRHDPLGAVLAIMPWNFPFWQVFRAAAPILLAGNVMVLKPSDTTPQCGMTIERIFKDAGLPKGVFQTALLTHEQCEMVIAHPTIRGVTLTGSTRAGRSIAASAGKNLKKCVLELGGSDPFIVFADAHIEEAVSVGITARFQNSGQSCVAAKRFLIEETIFEKFTDAFTKKMKNLGVGHPLDEGTYIGPLANAKQHETFQVQIEDARSKGAHVVSGQTAISAKGFYVEPCVITGVTKTMRIHDEEVFGPAAQIAPFKSENEAWQLANESAYGLGSNVWTQDAARAARAAKAIEAGQVFINGMVRSDPRVPFGGVKDSGFGRELGQEGLLEFTNIKTICLKF
jgi:succinate-semialdehyde dehydrogenase/glutarate-semialdehyde dehydrogenase